MHEVALDLEQRPTQRGLHPRQASGYGGGTAGSLRAHALRAVRHLPGVKLIPVKWRYLVSAHWRVTPTVGL